MPIAHAQFTVTTLCLYMMIAFEVLTESLSIQHLVAQTARRNSYQPVLVRNCAIVEAWLPFMMCSICILRTLLSGLSFLFRIYANCGAIVGIASMTYMTIVELFAEHPTPFSREVTIVINHDTYIYSE